MNKLKFIKSEDAYRWIPDTSIDNNIDVISVSKSLFDETGRLKPFVGSISVTDLVQRVSEMVDVVDNNDLYF